MQSKRKNQHYSPEFKVLVVETMIKEKLSYRETEKKFGLSQGRARVWESIYQEGGPSARSEERRGRGAVGRPRSVLQTISWRNWNTFRGEERKTAPNLLKRDFEAQAPNQKWVTDVTEFKIHGEKLYLSPILDLYDQSIISYSLSERPALSLVMDMLKEAFKEIPDGTGLILHSDQGW